MAKATAVGKSKYNTTTSANTLARNSLSQMQNSLTDRHGNRMAVNDLDSYVTDQLRNDYSDFTDYGSILNKYNAQSDASWDLSRAQQIQAMNSAEAQNYANTQNSIAQMRNALAGSASSGANRGAANATALQALLGLGQQNSQTTTEAMQGYQNTSREAAAARAANAVSALDSAREGTNSMYENATSAYNSDHLYGNQGIAESIGTLASGMHTDTTNDKMNKDTNATNLKVAKTTQKSESKQTVINKKG